MRKNLIPASLLAVGLALTAADQGSAQTTTFAVTGNNSATVNTQNSSGLNGTPVQTSTPGQFFTGYSPVNLVQSPVNFTSPMQSPVNVQGAMRPSGLPTAVASVSSAFRNMSFPVFRSHAPNVPIVSPGPGNPIQPTGLPAFHSTAAPPTTNTLGTWSR
jgi:hypothetical protein